MTTPNIQGEGMQPLNLTAENAAIAARLASQGFDPRREDPALRKLMSEAMDLTPRTRSALFAAMATEGQRLMGLSPASVHIDNGLANQFNMYANRDLIADDVLPVVAVDKKSDKLWSAPVQTLQTIANASMASGRARPNEVAYSVNSTKSYSCADYGLVDFIDAATVANADAPLNPRVLSATVIKSFLDLAREVRVAGVVFGSSNYGSNTSALSGSSRWDNASSDPIPAILAAKESCFVTPNTLVLGGQVWPYLRTNANVIKYITSRAGTSIGAVPPLMMLQYFAEMLELDRVVIGRAKYISSQEAGTTSAYVWGKSAALIRVEPNPNPKMTSCFGYTYRWGSKAYRNEVIPERMSGLMGGEYLKLTHSDHEVAIETDGTTGYLWTTVVS